MHRTIMIKSVGDEIESGGHTWEDYLVLCAFDYSALFSNNNDSMFDSVKFGVSVVCPEEFDSYKARSVELQLRMEIQY